MKAALIFVIMEYEEEFRIRRPVEWAWDHELARKRCEELDKAHPGYTHSLLNMPNFVDAR
jgi:hypothetical protein